MEVLGTARPTVQTQAYKDLFAGAGQPAASLLKGMVTLWATEKCYLLAWSYAASQVPKDLGEKSRDVMQSVFIPNWSSKEFEDFVMVLEELIDDMWRDESRKGNGVEAQERFLGAEGLEEVWRQVLWAEKGFWPEGDA